MEKQPYIFWEAKKFVDYLDFIVRPADLEVFIHDFTNFINNPAFPHWDQLILHNLLQTSPTVAALEKAARQNAWSFTTECIKQSPFIKLPGNWEDYLNSIDKKQRHEIRRKMHRAEENTDLTWYFVDNESNLDGEIETFLRLMAFDQEKSKFLTAPMREQNASDITMGFQREIPAVIFF